MQMRPRLDAFKPRARRTAVGAVVPVVPVVPIVAVVFCFSAGGCQQSPSIGNQLRAHAQRPAGGFLSGLRERHGGTENWQRYSAVRFRYHIDWGEGQSMTLPEVAFRLRDFRRIWVRPRGARVPTLLSLDSPPGKLASELLYQEGSDGPTEWQRLDPARTLALDFALRSVRYHFDLPLGSSVGHWRFRTLLGPGKWENPQTVEVGPIGPYAPHGPYLLRVDARTGLLGDVLYQSRHPYLTTRLCRASFSDYVNTAGMRVATHREHKEVRSAEPQEPRDPLHRPEFDPPEPQTVLIERIEDITFLNDLAADVHCPLPEEEKEQKEDESGDRHEERAAN